MVVILLILFDLSLNLSKNLSDYHEDDQVVPEQSQIKLPEDRKLCVEMQTGTLSSV